MKILIITSTFKPELSGIAETVYKRVKEVSKDESIEVMLLTPDYKPVAEYLPNYSEFLGKIFNNVEVKSYPSRKPKIKVDKKDGRIMLPFWKYSLDKVIEEYKPDIIHVDEPERLFGARITDGYMRRVGIKYARKNGIPTVAMWHTDYYKYAEFYMNVKFMIPIAKYVFRKIIKYVYNAYDITICSTKEGATSLRNFGVKNIKYMNSIGIDLDIFYKKNVARDEKIYNLLYVGRITPEKSIDVLFSAYSLLKKSYSNLVLHIIGDGPYFKHYETLYKGDSNVKFYGKIDHDKLPEFYSRADLFVNPSYTETFGMVNLEAAACSLPIVAANEGGNLETVIDGYNGFLFKVNDPVELSKKIDVLIKDPDKRDLFSKNSRIISYNFCVKDSGNEFINIWRRLISSKKESNVS